MGPLLFVLYINDLPEVVKSEVYLFADDTKIYCKILDEGSSLQEDLTKLEDWSNKWFLQGNTKDRVSCPVTPGGVLKKTLDFTINKGKSSNNKIIGDRGHPIHGGLRVKDPMRSPRCVFGDP